MLRLKIKEFPDKMKGFPNDKHSKVYPVTPCVWLQKTIENHSDHLKSNVPIMQSKLHNQEIKRVGANSPKQWRSVV
jgi:hypothetical protein